MMRHASLCLLALIAGLWAWGAQAAVAHVQTVNDADCNATSQVLTVASTGTADTALVILFSIRNSTVEITGITDNGSNTWSQAGGAEEDNGSNEVTDIWIADGGGAATSVTVTLDAATASQCVISFMEFSGYDETSTVLENSASATASQSSLASGTIGTLPAGSGMACVSMSVKTQTAPSDISWTTAYSDTTTVDIYAYYITGTSGTQGCNPTQSPANQFSTTVVGINATAAGGGAVTAPPFITEMEVHQ